MKNNNCSSLISVIVPIYNVENYLNKCINSILEQTYSNLEIILIDDGSTDKCPEICDMYAKKDSRIKVIHKDNGGLSDARNCGIEVADGKFISFVDSDDFIHPEMIEKMYSSLINQNADMCICGMKWINEDGTDFKDVDSCPIDNSIYFNDKKYDVFNNLNYFYYVTAVNKLYKRDIFDRIKFPYKKRNEDEFTAHYIFDLCNKIVTIEEILYFYVQRKGSITHSEFNVNRFDIVDALIDRSEFFSKKELSNHKKIVNYKIYYTLYKLCLTEDVYVYRKDFLHYIHKVSKTINYNYRIIKLYLIYILKVIKGSLQYNSVKFQLFFRTISKNNKKIIMLATPTHGNLGDQAIVLAEKNMLNLLFPNKKILEIPNDVYLRFPDICKKNINLDDIIIIDGGGNLGSLWPWEDKKISNIISDYKENKIIIFPQTAYYNPEVDKKIIESNRKIYENAKDLTIMLRDKRSFELFNKLYSEVNTIFVPDIVLFLQPTVTNHKKCDVLFCLRDDLEKCVDLNTQRIIENNLKEYGYTYDFTTTVIKSRVWNRNRKKVLQSKWDEFSSANLIITDRLHGMIFAAITGTPCIALDNISKKVSGVYKWIENLDYIKCVNNVNEVILLIPTMINNSHHEYNFKYPINKIKEIIK